MALAILAAGCSTGKSVRRMFGGSLPFHVTVLPGANENSAVAVDLVVVYDQKLADELLKLPAVKWFSSRDQYKKDHGDQLDADNRWEWVPGQAVPPQSISYRAGARKVLLFANYDTQGDHREAINPQQPFHLVLGERDFIVEETK